jgi:hypothetical protein
MTTTTAPKNLDVKVKVVTKEESEELKKKMEAKKDKIIKK